MKSVFDTNILSDMLAGVPGTREEYLRASEPAISIVSFIELIVGLRPLGREEEARKLLTLFRVHPVEERIAEEAIDIRIQRRGLKFPDALIWATARATGPG